MNIKLVESIVQMIQTLSAEEQQMLVQQLNTLLTTTDEKPDEKPVEQAASSTDSDAWDVFLSLGSEAQPGHLQDAAVNHDRYLYSQPS
ncbi:MAG: hypothetical protein HC895_04435 [Leptolyngbyaceae cyanobacterium SM1_3_5]|nr:hypothetical protein [Leptolyngbyaceae cyanobacterium SM1_3_5]